MEKNSAENLRFFAKNCQDYIEQEERPYSFWGTTKAAGKVLDQAFLQCLPQAGKKAVVGVYEMVKALPSLIGYLLTTPERTQPAGPSRQELAQICAQSLECKRALARNTIRYREMTPAGEYQISDVELDKALASTSFNDLFQQAVHDLPSTQRECQAELGRLRREVAADGEDWTVARHQNVYDKLKNKAAYCPPALGLLPPSLEPPLTERPASDTMEACLRKEQHPVNCLGLLDKVAVAAVCLGPEARDKLSVEFCAEVTQYLIPLPLVGPQTKVVKATGGSEGSVTAVTTAVGATASKGVLTSTQKQFVAGYKGKVFASEAQNSRYITMAENSTAAVVENRARYFDVENSVMKKLNDKTNNKDLVTSITNYQKETLIRRLEGLKEKYPEMQFELYSDFKSVKIGVKSSKEIDPATHAKLLQDLEKIHGESNADLVAKMKELKVEVPEAGDAKEWFKAGWGRSTDEAALAARQARQESNTGVFDFTKAEVRGKVENTMAVAEKQRGELASAPPFKKLMEENSQGIKLPREEVFDLVRKTDNTETLAETISRRYGIANFTTAEAAKLQAYAKTVDELQPPILISKRELMSLDGAAQGGATADFLGMGSANLRATAEGIAGKATVEDAIAGIRAGEKRVTRTFQERMTAFKKKVKNANCSGDDCETTAAIATADKIKIMNSLAQDPKTRKIRMSFFAEGVAPESRRQIASHGESLEKAFRKEVEAKIPYSKLKEITIGFDMKSTQLNQGSVDMLIGRKPGVRFTAAEQKEIQAAFARALSSVGKEARGYNQGDTVLRGLGLQGSPLGQTPRILGLENEGETSP